MPQTEPITAAGMPWYARKSYPRVLEIMADADQMPASYDHWLARAERAIERARAIGLPTLKAHLDPDQFLIWCESVDLAPDNRARVAYVERVLTADVLEGHA